jgi:hypothetical protein
LAGLCNRKSTTQIRQRGFARTATVSSLLATDDSGLKSEKHESKAIRRQQIQIESRIFLVYQFCGNLTGDRRQAQAHHRMTCRNG